MSRLSLMFFVGCSLLMTFGCAMKSQTPAADQAVQQTTAPTPPVAEPAQEDASLRAPQGQIVEEPVVAAPQPVVTPEPVVVPEKKTLSDLLVIPFTYDQHILSDEARTIILANAEILKPLSKVKFQLAGYCDERGSDQYNIALGERRAEAVRSYLIELGIDTGRMETVSYGEERPRDAGHDESAWVKNRRVEFVLLP